MSMEVLYQLHDTPTAGHLGIAKTLQRVRQRYYWVGCHQDVQQWCKSCDACAARKGPPKAIRVANTMMCAVSSALPVASKLLN